MDREQLDSLFGLVKKKKKKEKEVLKKKEKRKELTNLIDDKRDQAIQIGTCLKIEQFYVFQAIQIGLF